MTDNNVFRVGDQVELLTAQELEVFGAYYSNGRRYPEGSPFLVTRIYTQRMIVRDTGNNQSFQVWKRDFQHVDPNRPQPRKIGTMPEEGEHLAINDPRIQWIWDDMARYADGKSWCGQYDDLCKDIGIPGRPQDYLVVRSMNGINFTTHVKARSQAEAEAAVDRALEVQDA